MPVTKAPGATCWASVTIKASGFGPLGATTTSVRAYQRWAGYAWVDLGWVVVYDGTLLINMVALNAPSSPGTYDYEVKFEYGGKETIGRLPGAVVVEAPVVVPTLSSLVFTISFPPAGPTHWLPYWKPAGKDWICDSRGWILLTQMAWFQNVLGGKGVFGWYFWNGGISSFYATPEIVAAEGDIWTYWYNFGTLSKG